MERAAAELTQDILGLLEAHPLGRRPNIIKIELKTSRGVWKWLKYMRGRRMRWSGRELWHHIEKEPGERLVASRVSALLERLHEGVKLETPSR